MENTDTITQSTSPFSTTIERVSCVTAGPNQVFIGTSLGDIKVISRVTGEEQPKSWRQDNTPIEGMMYDFEGKLIYATEFNLVILDKNFSQPIKEIRSYEPLPLTHLTGRRMFPTLDHRKVYWWGEKQALSIIDLATFKTQEYPMAIGNPGAKLVTYQVLVINQKLVYIMNEDGGYKMVYYYDLLQNSLIGTWDYSNDEFEDHGVVLRALAANEKANILAFGGCASPEGDVSAQPFISIHRIDKKCKFPKLCSVLYPELEEAITSLEFIYLSKKPTLLACDSKSLLVLLFKSNKLTVLQQVKLHSSDINCLSYHRLDIFTGSDDKTLAKISLNKKLIKVPKAPPAF